MSSETAEVKPKRVMPKGGKKKGSPFRLVPPMLRDLRWAYDHADKDKVGTQQQERFRQMFKDKPDEFITLLRQMEREHKPAKKAETKAADAQPVAPVEEDVGTAAALELARRWLREWNCGTGEPDQRRDQPPADAGREG